MFGAAIAIKPISAAAEMVMIFFACRRLHIIENISLKALRNVDPHQQLWESAGTRNQLQIIVLRPFVDEIHRAVLQRIPRA